MIFLTLTFGYKKITSNTSEYPFNEIENKVNGHLTGEKKE
jgi:hypothetical protein